ncbi:hypothetical protein E2C01_010858 [Portunus trituberculatus]|uniref:Uncharacterized protein n=1 Tax=Portunus trituberculatus TaxID=210409 RepID=A0A5B7D9R5_PORTR|nr:hypothetical protein [Portunus trituberculatus]
MKYYLIFQYGKFRHILFNFNKRFLLHICLFFHWDSIRRTGMDMKPSQLSSANSR